MLISGRLGVNERKMKKDQPTTRRMQEIRQQRLGVLPIGGPIAVSFKCIPLSEEMSNQFYDVTFKIGS